MILRVAFVLFFLLSVTSAGAQAPPSRLAAAPTATTVAVRPTPTAIPLPEISREADSTSEKLRAIVVNVSEDPTISSLERDLVKITRELDARILDNSKALTRAMSLETLRDLQSSWDETGKTFSVWSAKLTLRANELENDVVQLQEIEASWKDTSLAARTAGAPAEVLSRIHELLGEVRKTREVVESLRPTVLTLQARVAQQNVRVNEALATLETARQEAVQDLMVRSSKPVWELRSSTSIEDSAAIISSATIESQALALVAYCDRQVGRLILHVALTIVLIVVFRNARNRAQAAAGEGTPLGRAYSVLLTPYANAILLSLLISGWIYPDAPRMLWTFIGISALVPTVAILRRCIEPRWTIVLYALVVFCVADQVRYIAVGQEFFVRALFIGEMLCGLLIVTWFVRSGRLAEIHSKNQKVFNRIMDLVIRSLPVLFLVALLANALGYVPLADLIGNTLLDGMYLWVVLYAFVRVASGFVLSALQSRPLALLRIIKLNGRLIHSYFMRAVRWAAGIFWLAWMLEQLSIRDEAIARAAVILNTELVVGSLRLSLGSVLAFGLTVWAAFLLSRFIRFLLEEEVYARVRLSRGLPYAISTVLHYVILIVGFLMAVAALGFDMTKFTVLAGAFGVGLGFGLQTIINNFFSGLIVLFERPIRVGDVIQMDDMEGVVQRIGIRASFIRTHQGSEVIVPNAKLISDRVTNWTFSNRQRAIEISVNVAYSSDPALVVEILKRAAIEDPRVVREPSPQALFTKFDGDFVTYQLRVFTDRFSEWMQLRSDLGIKIQSLMIERGIKNK